MIYVGRGWGVQMKEEVFICKLEYNSNRRPQFTSQFIEDLSKILGTKKHYQWYTTLKQIVK